MKTHFEERIDETRQAYLEALNRLKAGTPNHPDLKGKKYKINAFNIALESGKSRNPLYHTHKDILEMIHEIKEENKNTEKKVKETSEMEVLKEKIKQLEEENKRLMSANATLLFKTTK